MEKFDEHLQLQKQKLELQMELGHVASTPK